MKTIAQSLTVSAAIYTALLLLIAGIAYGTELNTNKEIDAELTQVEFVFEEEEYIDDIPFDTESIVENYLQKEAMNTEFDFEEEAYVDDIPFNTTKIALENEAQYASVK